MLIDSPKVNLQSLSKIKIKNKETIIAALTAKFGKFNPLTYLKEDSDLLISQGAFDLLLQLAKNPNVTVCIITANKMEYFDALLEYQNFPQAQITNININDSGCKKRAVSDFMEDFKPQYVFIFEDNDDNCRTMYEAAKRHLKQPLAIKAYHHKPTEFDWDKYWEQIQAVLNRDLIKACFFQPTRPNQGEAGMIANLVEEYCVERTNNYLT